MRIIPVIIIMLVMFSNVGARDKTSSGKLIVVINNVESNRGEVLSHLFNNPDGYPTESQKCMSWTNANIENGACRLVFRNIPFGEYALTVHHDENKNGVMDKNLIGMPAEGYGFSANDRVLLAVPDFDDCKFSFASDGQQIIVKMRY
jgi:uncharacterized protein (DUF2141 family)